jgi:hypothetical protein
MQQQGFLNAGGRRPLPSGDRFGTRLRIAITLPFFLFPLFSSYRLFILAVCFYSMYNVRFVPLTKYGASYSKWSFAELWVITSSFCIDLAFLPRYT